MARTTARFVWLQGGLPSIFPPRGQLDLGSEAAWSGAVRGWSVAVSATVRPWSAHVKAVSFQPLIWPTRHPAARCNIRLTVSHAATSVSPPRNGWSHVVLSRIGKGGILEIQGLARGGRTNSGPFVTFCPLFLTLTCRMLPSACGRMPRQWCASLRVCKYTEIFGTAILSLAMACPQLGQMTVEAR